MEVRNMNIVRGTIMLLLFLCLYIGGPILLIVTIRKWRKKRKRMPKKPRNYKIFPIWILLINAIPAFIMTFQYQGGENNVNDDVLGPFMMAAFIITIAFSFIQCKTSGVWIGPLRWIAGLTAGVLGGCVVIIGLGLILLLGVAGVPTQTPANIINVNGRRVNLTWDEANNVYRGDNGEVYEEHFGGVKDYSNGDTYKFQ